MDLLEGKVVGIYNNINDVNSVLNDLHNNGFNEKYVSVIGKNTDNLSMSHLVQDTTEIKNQINVGVSSETPTQNVKGSNVNNSFDEIRNDRGVEITTNDIAEGAKSGLALGMVGALATLMIPGIGPVLATGPILAAISSIAGGVAIGSVLSLLKDDRIPNSRADFYTSRFNEGNTLVIIDTDLKFISAAKTILSKYNSITVDSF